MQKHKITLPQNFIERLTQMFGGALVNQIQGTFKEKPTTFRINTIKNKREIALDNLQSNGFKLKQIGWYKDAFILQNKSLRELSETDLYKNGAIYVQSLASMVPPLVLDPKPGDKVLDLTAAPGSKTSQLAALMNKTGELVANDNNEIRYQKLRHNMDLLGVSAEKDNWKMKLENKLGTALCKEYLEYFDKILLDVPCSAEARFVLDDPRTFSYWNERDIKEIVFRQRQLLFAAWRALKPGGILVYSTCTFAPEENEMQIVKLKEEMGDKAEIIKIDLDLKRLPIAGSWKDKKFSPEVKNCLRIMPSNEIEGFFVAKIKKFA